MDSLLNKIFEVLSDELFQIALGIYRVYTKKFVLTTDTSCKGIVAILKQSNIHVRKDFIEAFSKSFDKAHAINL